MQVICQVVSGEFYVSYVFYCVRGVLCVMQVSVSLCQVSLMCQAVYRLMAMCHSLCQYKTFMC